MKNNGLQEDSMQIQLVSGAKKRIQLFLIRMKK